MQERIQRPPPPNWRAHDAEPDPTLLAAAAKGSKTVAMPTYFNLLIRLETADQTEALGHAIASALETGDVLLLSGPVGAGKSALARAIIQARLGRAEEVPSPTFTLVQTYDAPDGNVWHADLYRLSHPDEIVELGLEEAFSTAICLIEWPDRLGRLTPEHPVRITLSYAGDGREASVSFQGRQALATALRDFAP